MKIGTNNTRTVELTMGARIRKAREELNLSRAKLADKLNECECRPTINDEPNTMTLERLKQWEYGNNPVELEWIPAICEVLKCDVGYLFGEYESKKREYSDACATTGLSQEAIIQLGQMYHDSHYPDGVGFGVSDKGYTLGYISILDALIKSGGFLQLLDSLSKYLICGEILPEDAYTNDEQDLTPDEHERFFRWANKRGLEIRRREDIREMHLQTACDVLKTMLRDILKKELNERG